MALETLLKCDTLLILVRSNRQTKLIFLWLVFKSMALFINKSEPILRYHFNLFLIMLEFILIKTIL